MSLADFTREAVRRSEMSPYRIALNSHMDPAAMSRFLSGKQTLSEVYLSRVLATLNTSITVGDFEMELSPHDISF